MAVSLGEVRGQVRTTGCCALIFNDINNNANIKVQARARTHVREKRAGSNCRAGADKRSGLHLTMAVRAAVRLRERTVEMCSGDAFAFKLVVLVSDNACCSGRCDQAKVRGKDNHCVFWLRVNTVCFADFFEVAASWY